MNAVVVDASAAVEYLLRTRVGQQIATLLDHAHVVAPALLDVEVLSVLRRTVLHKKLDGRRARVALDDLIAWHVDRVAHPALLYEAWRRRLNVSAYDAVYVAAAYLYDLPLITADGPLSRAPAPGIVVQNFRITDA